MGFSSQYFAADPFTAFIDALFFTLFSYKSFDEPKKSVIVKIIRSAFYSLEESGIYMKIKNNENFSEFCENDILSSDIQFFFFFFFAGECTVVVVTSKMSGLSRSQRIPEISKYVYELWNDEEIFATLLSRFVQEKKKVVVDYSSPNIAKQFHIGNLS